MNKKIKKIKQCRKNYMFKIFILHTCISVHFSQKDDYQYLR